MVTQNVKQTFTTPFLRDSLRCSPHDIRLGYRITTDMMKPSDITTIKVSDLVSVEPSKISMMPPGLLSTMSDTDILDLLAYLLSAGNPDDELFKN